jgi:hypothetical protein
MPSPIGRRTFFRHASGALAVVAFDRVPLRHPLHNASHHDMSGHDMSRLEHPDPRAGITAEHVLTAEALGTSRKDKVLAAYEAARSHPEIFDGLACACGCTGKGGTHRSLLTCYETMQPTGCMGCVEEAELVLKLIKEDKQLADIRAAIDKAWG